jgi:integrase
MLRTWPRKSPIGDLIGPRKKFEASPVHHSTVLDFNMRSLGRIYKRGGLYWIQYSNDGQRYRESTRSTSIQTARAILRRRLTEGIHPTKETVADLMERVFEDYELHGRSTLEIARQRWRVHLAPAFGHRQASYVDEDRVREYMLARRAEGAKPATINRELSLLKRAFRLGKLRLDVSKLREDNVRTGFITEKQAEHLATECTKVGLWMRALFAVLFEFGFRIGEALPLRVSQVDLARRSIRLNPGETKSGEGREAVMTRATLELVRMCCAGKKADDFLFTRDGQGIKDFRGVWRNVTKAAGMPGLHVHDLRRSAIRRMLQRGIPQHIGMQISGHKTVAIFHRYAIVSHADLVEAARKLESRGTIGAQFMEAKIHKSPN